MKSAIATLVTLSLAAGVAAQTAEKPSIAGAWTLNKELSDAAPGAERDGRDEARGRGDGSGRSRGGGRRGGYGMGGGRGAGGMSRGPEDREAAARMRDARRDLLEPSDHLTITQTDSMIVITAADGRTTRLAPDGTKIKDENTKVERRSRWEGGKLVSDINGIGSGKMTQTFAVEPESHRLRVTLHMEGGGRSAEGRTIAHVYDADAR
jgi:hypothetical protein